MVLNRNDCGADGKSAVKTLDLDAALDHTHVHMCVYMCVYMHLC